MLTVGVDEIAFLSQLVLDRELELPCREPICGDRAEERQRERPARAERELARQRLMPKHRHLQLIPRPEPIPVQPRRRRVEIAPRQGGARRAGAKGSQKAKACEHAAAS